jgi:hypothetical protein
MHGPAFLLPWCVWRQSAADGVYWSFQTCILQILRDLHQDSVGYVDSIHTWLQCIGGCIFIVINFYGDTDEMRKCYYFAFWYHWLLKYLAHLRWESPYMTMTYLFILGKEIKAEKTHTVTRKRCSTIRSASYSIHFLHVSHDTHSKHTKHSSLMNT